MLVPMIKNKKRRERSDLRFMLNSEYLSLKIALQAKRFKKTKKRMFIGKLI